MSIRKLIRSIFTEHESKEYSIKDVVDAGLEYIGPASLAGFTPKHFFHSPLTKQKYLFKVAKIGKTGPSISAWADDSVTKVAQRVMGKDEWVPVIRTELEIPNEGKVAGTLQPFLSDSQAQNYREIDSSLSSLSDKDLLTLQKNQVIDWLTGNWDSHGEQWIKSGDNLIGIDKAAALRSLGKFDLKVDRTEKGSKNIYHQLFNAVQTGQRQVNIEPVKQLISKIDAIDDNEFIEAFDGYFKALHHFVTNKRGGSVEKADKEVSEKKELLLQRKRDLKKDFSSYYSDMLGKDVLLEMPLRLNQVDRPLVKDWSPKKWAREVRWVNVIGEYNGIPIVEGKLMFGLTALGTLNEDGTAVTCMAKCSQMTITGDSGPEAKVYKFFEIATDPEHRGKGLAKVLHDFCIKQFGGVASDNSLFETSQGSNDGMVGMWTKYLPSKYPCYVCMELYSDSSKIVREWKGGELDDEETILVALQYPADFKPETLTEMPEWADDDKSVGNHSSFNKKHYGYNPDMYDKFSLKREGDYEWHWYRYTRVGGIIKVDLVHEGNLIGRFEYAKVKPFYKMNLASVSSEHRGKGLALKTYKMIVDKVGTLESSQTLTGEEGDKGSFHIWQKLSKEYNSYLKHDYKLKKVDSFTEDMMDDYYTTFVVSKEELIEDLTETPVWFDANLNLGDYADDGEFDKLYIDSEKYPKIDEFKVGEVTCEVYEKTTRYNSLSVAVIPVHKGKRRGHFTFMDEGKGMTVFGASMAPELRGKGIGTKIYDYIINRYDSLMSDRSLTGEKGKGSFELWNKLGQRSDLDKFLYNLQTNKKKRVKSFTREQMGTYQRFLVSKKGK